MKQAITTDSLTCYKGHYYTGTDIAAMREWISDCQWPDLEPEDIAELTPIQVLIGIKNNYGGGIPAFIATIN